MTTSTRMISDAIPTTPQAWCKNAPAYVAHQRMLVRLVDYFEEHGVEVALPPEAPGWDKGRDVTVAGSCVLDLKTFGIREDFAWDSLYYQDKPNPTTFNGSLTDYFVHPAGDDVEDWVMGAASALEADPLGTNPRYRPGGVTTVGAFTQFLPRAV